MTRMKYQFFCISCAMILLIVVFLGLNGDESKSESSHVLLGDYMEDDFKVLLLSAPRRSILSLPHKRSTSVVAALDGTIHLVENGSMRVIWSFPTGSPIYSSYQAPVNKDNKKENVSGLDSEFMECGDDWALYIQSKHFGKMRLSTSVADFVAATPIFSDDGAVTLGSKKSTLFDVDAITGRIFRSYADGNASIMWSDDMHNVTNIVRTKNKEPVDLTTLSTPELLLKIIRTDYSLKAVGPRSGKVLWTMTVAEFNVSLDCKRNENLFAEASFDFEDKYVSDSGLDFTMPYACHDMKEVFRLRKNFLLQPAIPGRLHERPSAPTSDLVLPLQSNVDKFLNRHDDNMMLPTSVPKFLPSLQQNMGSYDNNDDAAALSQPPTEITAPGKDDWNRVIEWPTKLSLILFMLLLLTFLIYYYPLVVKKQVMLKYQSSESEIKGALLKGKRARKSRKNSSIVDKKDKHLSLEEDEDVMKLIKTDREARLHFNKVDEGVDGRRIGKLFISNKEIAKGSNGTIVLEGIYDGRAVAVKRLVQAHHDVALKEIQNLIASDCHPNIVRWYGVEHDQDFVYLALERCTCSLNDLIQIYQDLSENSVFSKDQASRQLMKAQIEIEKGNLQDLWKANGYPSPLLLKLMRDVVSGLVHLHDLGIIHRDMKPQNVLIIKERSLGAKLSDMGISKRLLGDMSSLGHNATGCGSSGWQAPEQLLQGRQTRSVDLFSLGCVLFYCITRGRHPFGDRLERDVNIVKNQKDLFLVEFIPEADDLISRLLNPDPYLRPKAIEVLHHPFFWSSEMRLSFLRDASDRVELEDRENDLLKALESTAPVALGAKWDEKMEPAFITNIGRYRRYKYDSVRDLLRVMRNKLNHYRELSREIQKLVGPVPEGFNDYFASRFPRLVIEVYKIICKYCKEEECFQRYFNHVY